MDWSLKTGNPGPFSQQIHLYVGVGDVLIEHAIPVSGEIPADK